MAIALFALGGGQASAATVGWYEDLRRGPVPFFQAGPGEAVDLTVRATRGTSLHPEEVVFESAAGTLSSPGTFPAPGACDPHYDQPECRQVPCHLESPHRARCDIYDGYTRGPTRLNPYESPYRSFGFGVFVNLSDADDRVIVPPDNPVRFRLLPDDTGGRANFDLSRVEAGFWAGEGDVIRSGPGANVGVLFWGSGEFHADNGRADHVDCEFLDGPYDVTIRADIHDSTGDCTGDIQPAPGPAGPVPTAPDADQLLAIPSDNAAAVRRCIERNVEAPGSCTTP